MKNLKISKELSLPPDAVTQTIGIIGRKGAGKTYLATMVAEQMLDIKAQTVIIDPVGVWWGLRIAADGKTKGKEIFVIGGDHGDIPLVPEAGKKLAQLIVEKGISAVIDVSGFGVGEHKRFCADFGEEFFQLKKRNRSPLSLILEEAQLVVPQNIRLEEARMYSAFERIVRLGRNYGIGVQLVTQRPQSVNKEVLSQVECLFVLQVTGPHERKALEYWVQEVGADRTLIGELPGLARGEGYVWSPQWLGIFKRVHFSKKTTFDASATPEVGKTIKAASLSAVDVEKLKTDMAEVISQAEKDDPVALRRQIAELKKGVNLPQKEVKVGFDQKFVENTLKKALLGRDKEWEANSGQWRNQASRLGIAINKMAKIIAEIEPLLATTPPLKPQVNISETALKEPPLIVVKPHSAEISQTNTPNEGISGPEQRILDAVAWQESIGIDHPEQTAVAFLAGYKVGGGAFNNPKGALRKRGLIEYVGSTIGLTAEGRALANTPDTPLTTEALHEKILARLDGPERRLLKPLLESYPNSLTNEELAQAAEYEVGGGAFNNPKGRLRTLGLIEYPASGQNRARDILFIE